MSEIKRIILYKHGMGYFERLSRVSGNQSIELEFKKGDMNDVLKSLSVLDLDGGVIASISCDAIRSVSEELDEIALDLPTEDVLSGLLGALRGIRLRITPAGQSNPVEGEIIGLETKPVAAGDGQVKNGWCCCVPTVVCVISIYSSSMTSPFWMRNPAETSLNCWIPCNTGSRKI